MQHVCFPFVFLKIPRHTCVFIEFSICFHATPLFSLRFPLVPTQHKSFRFVFNRFLRETFVLFAFSIKFSCNTYVFFVFSINSKAAPMFSLRFQLVPTQHICFPCISTSSHATHVFSLRFLYVPKQHLCFHCVFHLLEITCVFLTFSIGSNATPVFFCFLL